MTPYNLIQYLAQSISTSISSTSRPALTFFVIQVSIYISSMLGYTNVVPQFEWLISPATIAIAGILTVVEFFAQHDEDISSLLIDFKAMHLLSAFGAFSSALLFSSLGLPLEDAMQYIDGDTQNELLSQTQKVVMSSHDTSTQVGVIFGSVTGNLVLSHFRAEFHEWLEELSLLKAWQRIETGGVLGALIILLIAPILCLILLILALVGGLILGIAIKRVQKVIDDKSRTNCPECDHRVRKEAILCCSCGIDLEPQILLSPQEKKESIWKILKTKAEGAT